MRRLLGWFVVLLLLAALAGGAWIFVTLERPFRGYDAPEQFVEIPAGAGSGSMGRRLAEAGVVRSATAFRAAVWLRGSSRRLQAGEYRFDQPMTTAQVVDKIARGEVYVRAITFREGLTNREMAALFESGSFGAAADSDRRAQCEARHRLRSCGPRSRGLSLPDTYTLQRKTTAAQLVERMVNRFRKTLTPEMREEAGARGLSVRQLVTLASLVEKETGKAEERPIVAGVYTNRLSGHACRCSAIRQ